MEALLGILFEALVNVVLIVAWWRPAVGFLAGLAVGGSFAWYCWPGDLAMLLLFVLSLLGLVLGFVWHVKRAPGPS